MNKTGIMGETVAVRLLRDEGCRILTTNFRSHFGEIDIIAESGKFLLFVEVKARGENPIANPSEAVDSIKINRIIATAKLFLTKYPSRLQPRFDVIEVLFDADGNTKSINRIKNAFEDTGRR